MIGRGIICFVAIIIVPFVLCVLKRFAHAKGLRKWDPQLVKLYVFRQQR